MAQAGPPAAGAGGQFVSFLPGDNHDLASASTQQVLELINQDLSLLLRLPPAQFWQVALNDRSLHACLDSFLRFRRRCFDEAAESIQGPSVLLQQLSQRVFRVLWRLVHPQREQPPRRAQAGGAGSSKAAAQPAPPPPPECVAELLYDRWLMDVPKMLDLAALYGPGNGPLTGQLLQALLRLQPKYAQDVLQLAEPLSCNLHDLAENIKRLAGKALAAGAGAKEAQELAAELAEAARYFADAFLTLLAFAEVLPEGAALLLHPSTHGAVLLALAVVHSSALPALQRVAAQPSAAGAPGLQPARGAQLQQLLLALVFQLLRAAFCTPEGAAASGGPDAFRAAAKAAAAGSSSGSKQQQHLQQQSFSAEVQGQELMNLLMLLAHPPEYQQHPQEGGIKGSLLAAVNQRHHLDLAVATAVEQGLLSLDDAQFDYMLALVDGDRDLLQQRQQQQTAAAAAAAAAPAATSSGRGGAAAAAAAGSSGSSSSASAAAAPLPADLASKLSSIGDLLPGYGEGFLTALLFHCGWDTERAINALLEGSLPKPVQSLDPSLGAWAPPAGTGNAAPRGGGGAGGGGGGGALSWTRLAREAEAAAALAPGAGPVPLPSLAAAASAAPRPAVDRRTGRVLGALPSSVRSATKSIAQELQFEYDDEYDDSFDDLVGPGNEGVCDAEGEDSSEQPGARQQQQQPQQPQQQQQRGRKADKLWVLDGKIYQYKKEGALEVAGQAGADKALQAAKAAAQEIHGLGPGGNVPLQQPPAQEHQQPAGGGRARAPGQQEQQQQQPAGGGRGGRGGGRGDGGGGGSDGAPGGGGRGRGRGSFAHKEQHKSAIANHHRKDRATQKQARGML